MTIKDTYRDIIARHAKKWVSAIIEARLASMTRRWSSNPDMCDVHDSVAEHAYRVTLALKQYWPDSSADAITYALVHDLAEKYTGDWPSEFKRDNPDLAAIEANIAAEYIAALGFSFEVTRTEIDRVKMCDKLDAYLKVKHHKPWVLGRERYQKDKREVLAYAERLGVEGRVREAIA